MSSDRTLQSWNKFWKGSVLKIYYNGDHVGTRRADFVVEGKVIVELKAVIRLEDAHLAQAKNYVVAYNYPIGLLINFGAKSLEYKKVFNSRLPSEGTVLERL